MTPGRAAALVVGLAALAACGPDRSPDLEATEQMFLETCAPGGADVEVAVCRCAFERLVADRTAEEVEELDRRVRGADELPDEVVAAAVECAAEPLTPPTPPPPPADEPGGEGDKGEPDEDQPDEDG